MTLHAFTSDCAEADLRHAAIREPKHFTVDLHAHLLTPAVEPLVAACPQKKAEPEFMLRTQGAASVAHNVQQMLPQAFRKMTGLDERLRDMDAMGVDVQVLSPSPNQYYYWADLDLAKEIVRMQNEHVAATCAQHPERFAGLGTIALQHAELAVEQLTHAVKTLNLKGVEISTAVNGLDLADAKFEPFWAKASEYLKQIYFDSLVYSPEQLRNLIAQVGASQIVVGTDYAFDMGDYDVHELMESLSDLSETERAMILGGNAIRLLKRNL